jgi:3-phosphoshikimate 1-carboxyvinyltransferase
VSSDRPILAGRSVDGHITAPPSKSVTQRSLLAAALARGRSVLRRPLLSDDTRRLMAALEVAGIPARIMGEGEGVSVEVEGRGGEIPSAAAAIDAGNAGTAMRFLAAVLALGKGSYIIDGTPRMRERPIEDLLEALRSLGARAESIHRDGCPPVRVGGTGIPGGRARLRGSKSSQYLSAILLAAPASTSAVTIEIDGKLVSRPYVDLTIDVMRRFGARVEADPPGAEARIFKAGPDTPYEPRECAIEGDYSSASYFFAAAAVGGGRVGVAGLDPRSAQGDARFLGLLERMGCRVEAGEEEIAVSGTGDLAGIEADCRDMPDIVPTLAVVALFARTPTRISGVPHLRYKETDRITALVTEIRRLGGEAEPATDGLTIVPRPLSGARIETYGDHRMAMAFAVAGLRVPGTVIRDPACVGKSFPAFWDLFDRLAPA